MRVLRQILFRPLGIAIATVHWIVLLYAVLGDYNANPGFGSSYHPTTLEHYIFVLNIPALFAEHTISSVFIAIFQISDGAILVYLLTAIPLITLQWLFFGSVLELLITESRTASVPAHTLDIDSKPKQNLRAFPDMIAVSVSMTPIRRLIVQHEK